MTSELRKIHQQIINDPMNAAMAAKGYLPVYTAGVAAKIVIVGQAPGSKAQASMKPWNDASGRLLRQWLGVSDDEFYDPDIFALVPMDFYYPGKGGHGDLPPRKGFAEKWHPKLFSQMPDVRLIVLIGAYSQKYYLGQNAGKTLAQTIQNYQQYLPDYFPLVHPSPLNFRWRAINPWFERDVVPELALRVRRIIDGV